MILCVYKPTSFQKWMGIMKRVTRQICDDGPIPEEQETEGQRQLQSLLRQQLNTDINIDRCVAKKKCFAPAALYKPFGEQAAGVCSLAQFQALQDGERELTSLREQGLTDAEIELWRNKDLPQSDGKKRGVYVDPGVRDERLQVIRDKMAERAELLSRPQRFSGSRALSRREMEIEKALFHGNDRCSFLTALYHQEGDSQDGQQGETSSNPMDSLYRDFLKGQRKDSDIPSVGARLSQTAPSNGLDPSRADTDRNNLTLINTDSYQSHALTRGTDLPSISDESTSPVNTADQTRSRNQERPIESVVPQKITVNHTIGSLAAMSEQGPVTVRGRVEEISEEEIRNSRETEEAIRKMSRFQNYQPGEPSNVLCVKNMSPRASVAQLVSLFSRFQKDDTNPIVYRLLTGRLKGQAFITFSDIESAQAALNMVNGYRLLEKPLVIEFGRERRPAKSEDSTAEHSATAVQRELKIL